MGTFAEKVIVNLLSLPTEKNKLPFSIYVCSKQMKVCRFRFPFEANQRKLPFSVNSVFRCGIPETWRNRHRLYGETETWRHGDGDMEMETWNMETWKHGEMKIWRDMDP
jgi:hypothetical protein